MAHSANSKMPVGRVFVLTQTCNNKQQFFGSRVAAEAGKQKLIQETVDWFSIWVRRCNDIQIQGHCIEGFDPAVGRIHDISGQAKPAHLPQILEWMQAGCPAKDATYMTLLCYPCETTITRV